MTNPYDPEKLTDTTIVEGKPLAEWDAKLIELDDSLEGKGFVVVDMTTSFPGWALWCVREWRKRGRPTPKTKLIDAITDATAAAEKHTALANVELEKAAKAKECGNKKKEQQHRKYAATQLDKAEKFWDEVHKLRGTL